MTDIIFWVIVGLFIGWNLPQPAWAMWIQKKLTGLYNKDD